MARVQQCNLFAVGQNGQAYAALWDGAWHDWTMLGYTGPRIGLGVQPLAAVLTSDGIRVFALDGFGNVYAIGTDGRKSGDWLVAKAGVHVDGANLAVASLTPDSAVNPAITVLGLAGDKVYGTTFDGFWSYPWGRIGSGLFAFWTPLAALSLNPSEVSVFGVGQDGGVYTAWWDGAWHNWVRVGNGVFKQRTPLTAFAPNPNLMYLFGVGQDGAVYAAVWQAMVGWQEWQRVTSPFFFPGAPISAVSLRPNTINLFGVSVNDRVQTAWWDGSWHDCAEVPFGGWVFPPSSPVAAVSLAPGQVTLFCVDADGAVHGAWWDGAAWHNGIRIGSQVFAPSTPLTPIVNYVEV